LDRADKDIWISDRADRDGDSDITDRDRGFRQGRQA
jgi:hypothetical protein